MQKSGEEAAVENPNLAEARVLLEKAALLARDGDVDGCKRLCSEAADTLPEDVQTVLEYCWIASDLGLQDESEASANRALRLDPMAFWPRLNVRHVLYSGRKFRESIAAYEHASKAEDRMAPTAWCCITNAYVEVGDMESALETNQRAMELSRSDEDVRSEVLEWAAGTAKWLLERASLRAGRGDSRRALDLGSYATQIAEEDFDVWLDFGILAHKLRSHHTAMSALTRATELKPSSTDAWNNLGNVQRAMGSAALAVESYEQALLLEPKNYLATNNLALVLNDLERFEEARFALEAVIERRPDDLTIRWNFADALYGLGDLDGAATQYREALRIDPAETDLYEDLIEVLEDAGKYTDAQEASAELERVKARLEVPPGGLSQ